LKLNENLLYFLIFLSFVIAGCTDNDTVTLPIPGVEPVVTTDEYTYTLDENGRLATCKEMDYSNKETNYTFIWEEI